MKKLIALLMVSIGLFLSACATSYSPSGLPLGASSSQVLTKMGAPTGRYDMPDGGQRLEFARGPFGKHTYMLDFDANDRLLRAEQVLTEKQFMALEIGMTEGEVLRRIGHPSEARFLPRQQHKLWSYRYDTPFCIWFQVSVDTSGKVAELGNNVDPLCEPRDFGRF